MAKQVMLGVRLDAATRAAFKAWCAARQVTAQAVLRDDVARHLSSPAVPPIPRDRALVLMPRTWPKRLWGRLTAWTTVRKRR
jgi:ferric-dicitrate binding protein FerR (iron transport regulator)